MPVSAIVSNFWAAVFMLLHVVESGRQDVSGGVNGLISRRESSPVN